MPSLQWQPTVTLAPEAAAPAWRPSLNASDEARATRAALGLPADRPVILSGHQAALWHAGIAAKWLALGLLASREPAAAAWVVVDQDPEDLAALRYPAADPPAGAEGGASWRVGTWNLAPASVSRALAVDTPPALIPPFEPAAAPPEAPALAAAHAALARHRGAGSAAAQVFAAAADLLAPFTPVAPTPVFASALARLPAFAAFVAAMRQRARDCVAAYNAAAGRRPGAKVLPLRVDTARGRFELPLWSLDAAVGTRRRVWSDELEKVDPLSLAPRGLAMTAFLRRHVADLFIHGVGGAGRDGRQGYEAVTDEWISTWLGVRLAPVVTVSATLLLPLSDHAPVTDEQLRKARWTAHHARHSPRLLGEPGAEAAKRALAELLSDRRRTRAEKAELFVRLQQITAEARQTHADRLVALDQHADRLDRQRRADALAADRTWPFVLHSREAMQALRARLGHALGVNA